MSSLDYINALAARGVQLWTQDGKLQYKAPKELITPQLLAELKAHKEGLIALLEQFGTSAGSYALSYSQKSLWSLHQLQPTSAAYNVTYACRLVDNLDLPLLARCVDYLIARHPILRTRYEVSEGQPRQQVSLDAAARLDVERVQGRTLEQVLQWVDLEANKPFDLRVSPIRLKLLVNESEGPAEAPRHALLLNVHHVAADFWSLEIMVRELSALYALGLAGQPLRLAALQHQYKDFVQHEAQRLAGPEGAVLAAFWTEELQGELPQLALDGDRPRPPLKTEAGRVYSRTLDPALSLALRQAAREQRVTPYMWMLAVYQLLLHKHTGQDELMIGAPTSGRSMPGSEQVLGHFVNTLPLRCRLQGLTRFDQLLEQTRQMMLRVLDHQDYPFPLLVERLRPARDASRSPVFQLMYNWNQLRKGSEAVQEQVLFGPVLAASSTGTRGATHDLTLNIQDDGQDYVAAWTYNCDLFDEASIACFGAQFEQLLAQSLKQPAALLAEFRLPDAGLVEASPGAWPGTSPGSSHEASPLTPALLGKTWHQALLDRARAHPEQPALQDEARDCTLGRLARQVQSWLEELQAQGLREGSRVGLTLSHPLQGALLWPALLAQGAQVWWLGPEDRATGLDLHVRAPTASGQWLPALQCLPGDAAADAADAAPAANPLVGQAVGEALQLGPQDRLLLPWTPEPAQLALASATLALAWARGCTVQLAALSPTAQTAQTAQALAKELAAPIATFEPTGLLLPALLTPSLAQALRALPADHPLPRLLAQGMHAEPVLRWAGAAPRFLRLDPAFPAASPWVFEPAPQGWRLLPLAGCCAPQLRSAAGEPAAPRQWAWADSGPGGAPALRLRALGATLHCPDPGARRVSRGERGLDAGPVERCLMQQAGIALAVLLERPGDAGPVATAYVLRQSGPAVLDDATLNQQLQDRLRAELPEQQWPQALVLLEQLPLDAALRPDLARLPEPDLQAQGRAAGSAVEEQLAVLWCEVLGLESVTMDDDFFQLGGDSILAAVIVSKAGQQGLYLRPKDLFEHSSIARLARVVSSTPGIDVDQGPVLGDFPLGPAAHWMFDKVDQDLAHFNQALLLELNETPDPALMQQALQLLAQHHDGLRSRFEQREGVWLQCIAAAEARAPDFAVIDCRSPNGQTSLPRWREAIEQAQTGLDLAQGPLWRLRWLQGGSLQQSRLLVVIHHLLVDGVSWNILLQDLGLLYGQLKSGSSAPLPLKTSSVRDWVQAWQGRLGEATLDADRAHWRQFAGQLQARMADGQERPALMRHALKPRAPRHAEEAHGCCQVRLSAAQTAAFRGPAHQAYGTDANDLLVAALLAGFQHWGGCQSLLLDLEGHGREALAEQLDLSRSVGWFTSIYPVLVEGAGIDDPGRLIKTVKQRLREVPGKGDSFGPLRYLAPAGDPLRQSLEAMPPSPVLFTYLGVVEQMVGSSALFTGRAEPAAGIRSPRQARTHLLDVCAYISQGQLVLECAFTGASAVEETMGCLMTSMAEALGTLLTHCESAEAGGLTPSDVPAIDISQDGLDELLQELDGLLSTPA
ncbi:condensation domain-containing protein [Roseateles sp. DB2]|uniref:condensation domain-containing protein n=1 Tax=Roseateles sp. DB2 TaxID=3453717 RepID=UPI003EE98F36